MILNDINILNTLACSALENSGVTIYPPIRADSPTSGVDASGQRISMISKELHLGSVIEGNFGIKAIRSLLALPHVYDKVRAYALFSKASGFSGLPGIGSIKSLTSGIPVDAFEHMHADVIIAMSGPEFTFKAVNGIAKVTMQGQFVKNDVESYKPILFLSTQKVPGTSVLVSVDGVGLYVQVWNSAMSFKRNTYVDICKKFAKSK